MFEITLQFGLLVFGIVFLIVMLTRKAIKKTKANKDLRNVAPKYQSAPQKTILTEEQFNKTWKNLSYLILLAAAGNLYMVYTAVKAALASGIFVFWIDAIFSLLAAISAFFLWKIRRKTWVYIYFAFTLIPAFMFMSLKGPGFKESALIHLFPLVLIYFVVKPVWDNLED